MIFNLASESRARRARYKITTDDDNQDLIKDVTRAVHKQSKKSATVCFKTVDGLQEAVLSVQIAFLSER